MSDKSAGVDTVGSVAMVNFRSLTFAEDCVCDSIVFLSKDATPGDPTKSTARYRQCGRIGSPPAIF